jgi:TFIIH basal transcription factor complex TTD-A subunit
MSSKKKLKTADTRATAGNSEQEASEEAIPSAGYLVSCDVPTKQFIQYLNELKPADKKFILQDLDATHLLVKAQAKAEIERKIEAFFDSNVFSPVERVGEEFDTS